MEFKELVLSRRSIREYKESEIISQAELKEIIACAQQAPSWKNSQTARYYAVVSEKMREMVANEGLPKFNADNSKNAALVVTTFIKNRSGFDRDGVAANELGDEWGAYDLGLQNALFLLKAKELGYDTLVMGIRNGEALRKLLSIPDSEEVVSVIAVGKRAASEVVAPVRKETADIVKFF